MACHLWGDHLLRPMREIHLEYEVVLGHHLRFLQRTITARTKRPLCGATKQSLDAKLAGMLG